MHIRDTEHAELLLDEVGAYQQAITESGADPRGGADAILERFSAVVAYLLSQGYELDSIREQLIYPMRDWAVFTIAPRWIRPEAGDPNDPQSAGAPSKYLYDKITGYTKQFEPSS
ncbi:hypothetical protein [Curtobacterium sp. 'Ferrero']|uniref:hypothetical protein n=1 Tax=Curtobacterium sp. 'Ferrero' TaxID=2033654 RepID=UPI00114122D8|nr:hypothetical protein [Curtobacterium sp. 'Ferrero']